MGGISRQREQHEQRPVNGIGQQFGGVTNVGCLGGRQPQGVGIVD